MSDTSALLNYILDQTRQNIAILLSQNQISDADAHLILDKIPKALVHPAPVLTPPLSESDGSPSAVPPPTVIQRARAEWPYNHDGKVRRALTHR